MKKKKIHLRKCKCYSWEILKNADFVFSKWRLFFLKNGHVTLKGYSLETRILHLENYNFYRLNTKMIGNDDSSSKITIFSKWKILLSHILILFFEKYFYGAFIHWKCNAELKNPPRKLHKTFSLKKWKFSSKNLNSIFVKTWLHSWKWGLYPLKIRTLFCQLDFSSQTMTILFFHNFILAQLQPNLFNFCKTGIFLLLQYLKWAIQIHFSFIVILLHSKIKKVQYYLVKSSCIGGQVVSSVCTYKRYTIKSTIWRA